MPTHNLLWTSGWDSTFRLLQIILIEKKSVQPIYIIDKDRKSLNNELEAIERIKIKIQKEYPEAYSLILPTWFIEKKEIIINKEITQSAQYINSLVRMGSQYIWLAQFCIKYNLSNIEISLDKNPDPKSFIYFLTDNYLQTDYKNSKNKRTYNNIDTLFKYFSFPVITYSKKEMLTIIKKNYWEDIMDLTWFCHKPKKNKPCGKCVPCIGVIKKELGFRIPVLNRMKGYFKIYLLEIKSKIN